jgi:hypothetical protein
MLLFLWIAGAAVCRRFDVWFLSAMAFLISCGQSVYYVEGRHRLSIEPLILPMAAIGVLWLVQRLASRVPAGYAISPSLTGIRNDRL